MTRRKALFIVNAHAGKGKIKTEVFAIVDRFNAKNYDIEVFSTQAQGDATQVTQDKASQYDLLICSGGDGTLNETVTGLMQVKAAERPHLGYIPAGSTNDFAANLYPRNDSLEIVEAILNGEPFACDIGGFNERYFVYCAAFGAFVSTAYETPQVYKNILGRLAYLLEGTRQLPSLKSQHMSITYDGQTIEDDFLYGMMTNSDSIAGIRGLGGSDVLLDDGLFEILLIRMPKNPFELHLVITGLAKQDFSHELFYSFKASALSISAPEPVTWTLDGEFGGEITHAEITNHAKAVSFLIHPETTQEISSGASSANSDSPV